MFVSVYLFSVGVCIHFCLSVFYCICLYLWLGCNFYGPCCLRQIINEMNAEQGSYITASTAFDRQMNDFQHGNRKHQTLPSLVLPPGKSFSHDYLCHLSRCYGS